MGQSENQFEKSSFSLLFPIDLVHVKKENVEKLKVLTFLKTMDPFVRGFS